MKTSSWVPKVTAARESGDIDGVGDAELAGAGFDQGEEVVAVLGGGQVHADARVVPSEFADHGGRRVGGQGRQTGQGQRTRQQPGHRRHGGTPGFKVTQDLAGRPEQGGPGRGQGDPMADPGEQLGSDLGFEVLDRERQRRLGDKDGLGGCREPAVVGHGHEVGELPAVHLLSL